MNEAPAVRTANSMPVNVFACLVREILCSNAVITTICMGKVRKWLVTLTNAIRRRTSTSEPSSQFKLLLAIENHQVRGSMTEMKRKCSYRIWNGRRDPLNASFTVVRMKSLNSRSTNCWDISRCRNDWVHCPRSRELSSSRLALLCPTSIVVPQFVMVLKMSSRSQGIRAHVSG